MAVRILHFRYSLILGFLPLVFLIATLFFLCIRKYDADADLQARIDRVSELATSLSNDQVRVVLAVDVLARIHSHIATNLLFSSSSAPSSGSPSPSYLFPDDIFSVPTNSVYCPGEHCVVNGRDIARVGQFAFYEGCPFRGVYVISVDPERVIFSNGQCLVYDPQFSALPVKPISQNAE